MSLGVQVASLGSTFKPCKAFAPSTSVELVVSGLLLGNLI